MAFRNPAKNQYEVIGDLAYLTLNRGYLALVDAEDLERVAEYRWRADPRPHTCYAVTTVQKRPDTAKEGGKKRNRTSLRLHQLLGGETKKMVVDHVNGNGLDCRKANLRPCVQGLNLRNASRPNAMGYRGVLLEGSKYRAKIRINHQETRIGRYARADLAAMAYDLVAFTQFGEHTLLNFPFEMWERVDCQELAAYLDISPELITVRQPTPTREERVEVASQVFQNDGDFPI